MDAPQLQGPMALRRFPRAPAEARNDKEGSRGTRRRGWAAARRVIRQTVL